MIHMDSIQGQNLIRADLSLYQTNMPNEFEVERAHGLHRVWGCILYPDAQNYPFSSVEELRDCIYDFCVSQSCTAAMSPIHDSDVMPDGSMKKAHYHLYVVYKGPKYAQTLASLAYFINGGITPIQHIDNELGFYRYLAHVDSPDAAQYDVDDITVYNGYVPPASGEKSSAKSTEQLFSMVDNFNNVRELTTYVVQCRPDLINTLLRARPLIATYYGEYERHWTTS